MDSGFGEFNNHSNISFNYSDDERTGRLHPAQMFDGIAEVTGNRCIGRTYYTDLGNDRRALGISAVHFENGLETETGYYELDEEVKSGSKI